MLTNVHLKSISCKLCICPELEAFYYIHKHLAVCIMAKICTTHYSNCLNNVIDNSREIFHFKLEFDNNVTKINSFNS